MISAETADFRTLKSAQKAIIDGLPPGLAFAQRLPLFCDVFDVPWDSFQVEGGPSSDALGAWRTGAIPRPSQEDKLEASAKKVLMKRKGFHAKDAEQAAKWLLARKKVRGITEPSHAQDSSVSVLVSTRIQEWLQGLDALEVCFCQKMTQSSEPRFVMKNIRRLFSKANGLLNSMVLLPGPDFLPEHKDEAVDAVSDLFGLADDAIHLAYRSWDYDRARSPLIQDCNEVSYLGEKLNTAIELAFAEEGLETVPRPEPPAIQSEFSQPPGLADQLRARLARSLAKETEDAE